MFTRHQNHKFWSCLISMSVIFTFLFFGSRQALAIGGCGTGHAPSETKETPVKEGQLDISIFHSYGDYDNFLEGDSAVTNMGGNKAIIQETDLFLDYGVSERIKVSLLVPYVRKEQWTKKFGTRVAEGIGDMAIYGKYQITSFQNPKSPLLFLGMGLKFPTGGTDEPSEGQQLPPAFQLGTGSFDLIPILSYYQRFDKYALFANMQYRISLEHNKRGYQFGQEYRARAGAVYLVPTQVVEVALIGALDYLYAGRDDDTESVLPARMRDGTTVLNTGGRFLNFTPGIRLGITQRLALLAEVSIPLLEDWNGDRSRNVGQVAPDFTVQVGLSYSIL